jgi:hypothetical protein
MKFQKALCNLQLPNIKITQKFINDREQGLEKYSPESCARGSGAIPNRDEFHEEWKYNTRSDWGCIKHRKNLIK